MIRLAFALAAVLGLFTPCRSEPLPGQVVVSPTGPQWLERSGGAPIFLCGPGDPEGFLYRGSLNADGTRSGDQAALIEKLAGTGANCLYLMAVRSHGGDGDATENPFVNHDPAQGLDEDILAQWETWFAAMDAAGIVIYFIFYDDSARIWDTGDTVGADERDFVRALVNRFEGYRHLIWCVAEEYSESFSPNRVSNLAAEIRATDDHDHVIAVHQHSGLSFDFEDDPNVEQFAIQYNVSSASKLHSGMVTAWKNAAGRYQLTMSEAFDHGSGATARRKNWAAAMGGAYVMILGMDIATTPVSDLEDCGRLVEFFESTPFPSMAPRDDLAFGETDWVLASPPEAFIAYAANASGDLGVRSMAAGSYDLEWLDCASGVRLKQDNVAVEAGDRTWATPVGIGPEVALSVRAASSVSVERETWSRVKFRYSR